MPLLPSFSQGLANIVSGGIVFVLVQKRIKKIPGTTHVQNSGDRSVDGEVVRIRERDTARLLAARTRDKVATLVFEGDEHVLMLSRQTHAS